MGGRPHQLVNFAEHQATVVGTRRIGSTAVTVLIDPYSSHINQFRKVVLGPTIIQGPNQAVSSEYDVPSNS